RPAGSPAGRSRFPWDDPARPGGSSSPPGWSRRKARGQRGSPSLPLFGASLRTTRWGDPGGGSGDRRSSLVARKAVAVGAGDVASGHQALDDLREILTLVGQAVEVVLPLTTRRDDPAVSQQG